MAPRNVSLRIPRILTQNKAFSACVIFSLGIGISCSASVLALVDAMLYGKTLYANIDRLEVPYVAGLPFGARSYRVSTEVVRALMAPGSPLEEVAVSRDATMNLRDGPHDETTHGIEVSPNYMRLMSQRMHIGRPISEIEASDQRQVVLTYRFWTSEYGSDSSIIGRVVFINGQAHTLVGVAARDASWFGLWTSNPLLLSAEGWKAKVLAIGLRKRNIEPGQARAMIATIGTAAMTTRTSPREHLEAQSLRSWLIRSSRSSIILLGSIAIAVGLLTAVNFAGLVLARGIRRRGEIGVRAALGASVGRLAQHIVTESLVLCALGGVLAAVLAPSIGAALQPAFSGGIPAWIDFSLSWRILAASVALSMLIGIVFALGPALDLARPALGGFLRAAGVGVSGSTGASRARAGVVSIQVALAACFLIILGGLIGRSLWLTKIDPGYDFQSLLSGGVSADSPHPGVWANLRSRVEEIPGVVGASIVHARQLDSGVVAFEGAASDAATMPQMHWWQTDESFHQLLRTRLIAGRFPTIEEQRSRAPVAVVTRVVAQRAFADNAVGRTVRLGLTRHTIVGVIERLELAAYVEEPTAMVITPVTAGVNRLTWTTLWVRAPNATQVWQTLREIRQRGENRALGARLQMGSIADRMNIQTQLHRRIVTVVLAIFGVALGLASLGIYGLVSYTAEMRNREMAIREALGASRSRVAGLLLRGAFLQVAGGLVAGVLIANGFAWYMKAYRIELETLTRSTAAAVVLLLLTVLLSSLAPLRTTWRRNLSHVLRD